MISTWCFKRRAEQQEAFRILDAIVGGAHWINSISEIVFEFVKNQLTNPKLGKIRWSCRIMYSEDRFREGANFR